MEDKGEVEDEGEAENEENEGKGQNEEVWQAMGGIGGGWMLEEGYWDITRSVKKGIPKHILCYVMPKLFFYCT